MFSDAFECSNRDSDIKIVPLLFNFCRLPKEVSSGISKIFETNVSNILHGRTKKVSPEMVKKIQDILEEKNYVPRFGLSALKNRKSNIIGVLISTPEFVERSPYERPFYGAVIGTLESAFREKSYYIMFFKKYAESHEDDSWMKGFHWCDFEWDERTFPDVKGMLERYKKRGLKICA